MLDLGFLSFNLNNPLNFTTATHKQRHSMHYYSEIFHMARILTLKPSMYNLFLSFYFYYFPTCTADNTSSILTQLSSHTLAITFQSHLPWTHAQSQHPAQSLGIQQKFVELNVNDVLIRTISQFTLQFPSSGQITYRSLPLLFSNYPRRCLKNL